MNGHVLRELPIAVDCFRRSPDIQIYFLTHMHADHTVGLTNWWEEGKIHCTYMTAKMLHFKLEVKKQFIMPLEELQPHVLRLKTKGGWIGLSVTVIPANHCPGSCMFLFETNNIRILYTGDFRSNEQIYEIGKTLWGPKHRPINVLYLDNTYCEPACVFPSREEATKEIIKVCKKYSERKVYIGITWTGHEDLLEAIAMELKQYIQVTPKHLEFLKLMGRKNVFTINPASSNIHILETHRVNKTHMQELSKNEECIGIRATARLCHIKFDATSGDLMHTVLYSNHSSFSELWQFVKSVRPMKIKPVVKGSTESGMESHFRADMSQFDCFLNTETPDAELQCAKHFISPTIFMSVDKFERDSKVPKRKLVSSSKTKVVAKRKKPCGVVFNEND